MQEEFNSIVLELSRVFVFAVGHYDCKVVPTRAGPLSLLVLCYATSLSRYASAAVLIFRPAERYTIFAKRKIELLLRYNFTKYARSNWLFLMLHPTNRPLCYRVKVSR